MEKKVSRIERQQTTITESKMTCLVSSGQLIAGVFLVVFVIELGNGQFKDNSKNQALPTPWPDKVS